MKNLIVIAGPTAVGKTNVSIELAKHYNCEILSADSRQFFKEISIGTAKPTLEEMRSIKHHFIGHLSISEDYSAGKFENDALKTLQSIFKDNNIAILVGGSGLYIDAVCNGFDNVPSNNEIRNEIISQYDKEGIDFLKNELTKNDPLFYNSVDQNNPQRLMRGVEVFRVSGKPYSSFLKKEKKKRNFNIIKIILELPREELYNRINLRVDEMIVNGLEIEVKSVEKYRNKPALKTVGYSEFFNYFDGKISKDEAINLIKRNSRRYAKRQITWFKRIENALILPPKGITSIKKCIDNRLNHEI